MRAEFYHPFALLKKSCFRIFAICLFFVVGSVTWPVPAFASRGPIFELEDITGVTTILVSQDNGPDRSLFTGSPKIVDVKDALPDPVLLAVQDVFSSQPWIKVMSLYDPEAKPRIQSTPDKPGFVMFTFTVSSQQEMMDGKPVTIGSVGMQIWKYRARSAHEAAYRYALAQSPVTYPFLASKDEKETTKRITEGVRFLTAHLPSYFAYANKDLSGSTSMILDRPYGEK
jgi:hypothetical protein